jgi:hypothetical protein
LSWKAPVSQSYSFVPIYSITANLTGRISEEFDNGGFDDNFSRYAKCG